MKLLITGGAGFIGKWLVEKLPDDIDIFIVDSLDEQVHRSASFDPVLERRATCIKADVQAIEEYKEALEGIDTIVHSAAQTGTGQSMYELNKHIQHNANGTAKLDIASGRSGAISRVISGSGCLERNRFKKFFEGDGAKRFIDGQEMIKEASNRDENFAS